MQSRTHDLDKSLSAEMNNLWGPKVLVQVAPHWAAQSRTGAIGDDLSPNRATVTPSESRVRADIHLDQRYKGLLWYSTFTVKFSAAYTVPPATGGGPDAAGSFIFPLPAGVTAYDDLGVTIDDTAAAIPPGDVARSQIAVPLDRKAKHVVTVNYTTSGQDVWLYAPGPVSHNADGDDKNEAASSEGKYKISSSAGPLIAMNDFSLAVTADFADIDYPSGTRSPTAPAQFNSGLTTATWKYSNALTNQAMGVVMPHRTNAGPITARMSFFAPVSLFFFFTALFTLVVLRRLPMHPMHYLFIAAGFFAFHILLAYLADTINIHAAFWVCAVVSTLLVVSYMRLVAGIRFAVLYVGLAQVVYLVGFSYAFFWVGKTGLIIAIGAVATLFVLMQATGRLNWHAIFNPASVAAPRAEGT
jgi:hypothetical protein